MNKLTSYEKQSIKAEVSKFLGLEFLNSDHGKDFLAEVERFRAKILVTSYEFFYYKAQELLQSLQTGDSIKHVDFSVTGGVGDRKQIKVNFQNISCSTMDRFVSTSNLSVHPIFLPTSVITYVRASLNCSSIPKDMYSIMQDYLCPVSQAISAHKHIIDKCRTVGTLMKNIPNVTSMLSTKTRRIFQEDTELSDSESLRIIKEYNKVKGV